MKIINYYMSSLIIERMVVNTINLQVKHNYRLINIKFNGKVYQVPDYLTNSLHIYDDFVNKAFCLKSNILRTVICDRAF